MHENRLRGPAIFTAVLMLLGFVLPVLIPEFGRRSVGDLQFVFPNFLIFDAPGVPGTILIYVIFPIIGAALAFVAAQSKQTMTRVILFLIAGFLPYLLSNQLFSNIGALGAMAGEMRGMPGVSGPGMITFFAGLGLAFMIGGVHSGRIFKSLPRPGLFAGIGGIMMLIALIYPISISMGGLGGLRGLGGPVPSISYSLITLPFEAIGQDPVSGMLALLVMGLIITASVTGIMWMLKRNAGVNHSVRMRVLLNLTLLTWFVAMLITITSNVPGRESGSFLAAFPLLFIKIIAFFGGFLMAKAMFFAELAGNWDEIRNKISPPAPAADPATATATSTPVTPPATNDAGTTTSNETVKENPVDSAEAG
ncbi:MAG: hypothetical protein AAF570_16900, partial [Bacteroidota bacterium]